MAGIVIKAWQGLAIVTLTTAFASGWIDSTAILLITLYAFLCWYASQRLKLPLWLWLLILLLSILFVTHALPGFSNPKVIDNIQLSEEATAFSLYLNLDKAMVGLCLIGLLHPLLASKSAWSLMLSSTVPKSIIAVTVLIACALLTGTIQFEPKIPNDIVLWSLNNLFIVCVSEEALFRGLLQKQLCLRLQSYPWGNPAAVVMAALLFALLHYQGGLQYCLLTLIAGLVYGTVYHKTQSIEAAILTHFSVNLTHILFFTYPTLV